MDLAYLAIEQDERIHNRESKYWLGRNIGAIRVNSMREGLEQIHKHKFLYVGINASNVDYASELKLLRKSTNTPIFLSSAEYSMQEQAIAMRLGADLFGALSDEPQDNFDAVMAAIDRINEQRSYNVDNTEPLIHDSIILLPKHHGLLINGKEVELTKKEFDIFHYLMRHRGQILKHEGILHHVWDDDYDKSSKHLLWTHIKRLRKKLVSAMPDFGYIENIHNIVYRFTTQPNKDI
jgi:DNA-binding response OmpR family regulator